MASKKASPFGKPTHGTYSTYVNWGCRCLKCKRANATHHADLRERRKKLLGGAA